ncbi:unnamed protein product [Cochlearia groenlandica]
MAGFIKRRGNILFRSQTLSSLYSKLQRSNFTLSEGFMEKCSTTREAIQEDTIDSVDTSKWKKVRASDAGIRNTMIPESPLNVLRLLRRQGFDAYLVGGCVRDLILHRVPKDYDVITTANLKQIRRLFHRAQVIGKRFPICHVWMGGSIIEVSVKNGVPHSIEANNNSSLAKIYSGIDVKDSNRWRNSMQRDFTINSLFYDPFEFNVYDYTNGMEDLKDLKLRTLVPAHLSFKEDCARILRGLRIAARLGLSVSKDIKSAIPDFVSSVAKLDQFRLIMEMNYMFAYGAAAPSILLLMKFKLLHILLPFQAAYLDQATKTSQSSSLILVRLFSNMDKLVSCGFPADSRLWIALLAFHITLVRNPREAIVLRAFASLLYHRNWSEAVRFASEHEDSVPGYAPEVSKSSGKRSDEDLAEAVSEFANLLKETQYVLTEMEALREALFLYPDFKCSGLVFIPKKKGKDVAGLFARLCDVESYGSKKEGFSIDYISLGKGHPCEIGFVLGKIIMDTITEQLNSDEKKLNDHKNVQETELSGDSTSPVQAKDQIVVLKPKRRHKESLVSDTLKKKASKKSKSDDHKNTQETELCQDSTFFVPAESQDQSVAQKPKRRRKEAPVPETPKQKISKSSNSNDQETVGQENNKRNTKPPPVSSAPPKHKTSQKVKRNNKPIEEAHGAKDSFISDKSMNDLVKVLVKPSQQASSKEEGDSLSSEKTKRPRKLSSLFR